LIPDDSIDTKPSSFSSSLAIRVLDSASFPWSEAFRLIVFLALFGLGCRQSRPRCSHLTQTGVPSLNTHFVFPRTQATHALPYPAGCCGSEALGVWLLDMPGVPYHTTRRHRSTWSKKGGKGKWLMLLSPIVKSVRGGRSGADPLRRHPAAAFQGKQRRFIDGSSNRTATSYSSRTICLARGQLCGIRKSGLWHAMGYPASCVLLKSLSLPV